MHEPVLVRMPSMTACLQLQYALYPCICVSLHDWPGSVGNEAIYRERLGCALI